MLQRLLLVVTEHTGTDSLKVTGQKFNPCVMIPFLCIVTEGPLTYLKQGVFTV